MKSKLLLITRVFSLLTLLGISSIGSMNAQTYVTIGNGSLVNTLTSYPAPYGNFFYGARHQFLILASELSQGGVAPNSVISQIGFNNQTPAGAPLQNFTIKMASTVSTTLTTTFITAGLVQMMDPFTYTSTTGWNTHTFTNGGFVWDGISNLLVEVCFNNPNWTTNAITYYSTTPTVRASYRYADALGNCVDPGFATSTARPNMRLTIGGVNLPPPIAPLANFQFTLGVDTLWERSPSILTNTSTYQDRSYWDITGYNDDSTDGVWDPYYTVRQPNTWGSWIDTIGNKTNFNYKFPVKGFYKVKLTCVNQFGVSSTEKVVFVALPTVKPRAYFFTNMSITGVGEQFQFYDASSNGPIGWSWWLDPPCISCGQFINEFFPSNDLPRPVLNANEGGKYTVCMAVWNDIGGDTICRKDYVEIIDGFTVCLDSVSTMPQAYLHNAQFQTYSSIYYAAQNCPAGVPGFRIAPCADTIYIKLERLKMRNQDSIFIISGNFNGPIIRRWGGNNLAGLPDSSKNFKFVGQEIFVKFLAGTPNTPAPYWVNDSGFLMKWSIAPATFAAPAVDFTSLDTVYSGYKMKFTNTTPGVKIAYAWDLNGDGIYGLDNPIFPDSVTPSPTFTFFSFTPVTKSVCLRARNCRGSSTKCKPVVVLPVAVAPLADFTVNKVNGFTTDTFMFTDISQYGSNNWLWTFTPNSVTYLNGTTATSQNPIVKFNVAQSYDVTLQATNPFGTTTKTKTAYITTISYNSPTSIYPPQPSDMDVGISRVRMNGTAGKIDTITPLKDAAYRSYYLSSQAVVYRGGKYTVYVYRQTTRDTEKMRAWIDWNRNTNYYDETPAYVNDNSTNVMDSFPITVPDDAEIGLTRMLIGVCTDFSTITPNVATLGVYEDHGLIIAQDNVKPVVVLKGPDVYKTEIGIKFVDPGWTATDNIQGDISPKVISVGTVDTTKVGYYKLKYYVHDNYGNVSDTAYRLVQVEVSTVPPTLTLLPPDTMSMEVYSTFPEPGYLANDARGKDLRQFVVRGGNLDTANVGSYTVTYQVKDAFNNQADGQRFVKVVDTQKPVISCRLGANINTVYHELKTPYEDNDYVKVTDNYYRNVTFTRENSVNINKRGTYTLYYYSVDGSGNEADKFTLNVIVKSNKAPSIQLNGESDILLNVHDVFNDPGAIARDADGIILVVEDSTNLNIHKVGNYTVWYYTKDADENYALVTRSVRVRDTEAPKIEVQGADPLYLQVGKAIFPAAEPGVKYTDNYYNESELIKNTNYKSVNTNKVGQYFITYDAADPAGNIAASKSRMVIVVDSLVGLADITNANGFGLYPNPAITTAKIELTQGTVKTAYMIDVQGRATEVVLDKTGRFSYALNVAEFPAGFYILRIETHDGQQFNAKLTVGK